MLWILLFFFGFAALPAFAYLDPGTGSLLLYALVGIATTVLFGVRNLWYNMKGRAFLSAAPAVSMQLPDVVFHSEGGKYWQVFEPVITALEGTGISCAYVSPDPEDPGLARSGSRYTAIRPGKEVMTIAYMNRISAAMVVSTTPHLDVYMLKRSRKVRHYAHLFHAPTDVAFYEKFAFDWYDSLLTVGPFQERSVRQLERRRRLAEKTLHGTGCTYYDYMTRELRGLRPRDDDTFTVLYAPTWGERSSIVRYGTAILDSLAERRIRTIFRPHPQSYVSDKETMREVERKGYPTVEVDRNRTGIASMARSDVMITDFSGVLFDYAFLFERPIVLASSKADLGGQEAEDLDGPIWDVATARSLARCVPDGEIAVVADIALEAAAAGDAHASRIRELRGRELYNFGAAGPAAASNIDRILQGLA